MSSDKNVLLLGREDSRPEYDTAATMAVRLRESGASLAYDAAVYEDLTFSYDGKALRIASHSTGKVLDDYAAIFLVGWFKIKLHEDIVLAVARYANAKSIRCLNSEALHTRSRSKLSQYVIAALHGLRAAPFAFAHGLERMQAALQASGLAYPFILKSVTANRGKDNYLVRSEAELAAAYHDSPDTPFIAQAFVPNDGDYRLIVMGDTVTLAIHRKAQAGSHLNNTSQGGVATIVDTASLDPALIADAVRLSKLLGREIGGVDMVLHRDTGEGYLLEVNNMPQLSTGSMVKQKLLALDAFLLTESEKNDD